MWKATKLKNFNDIQRERNKKHWYCQENAGRIIRGRKRVLSFGRKLYR